MRILLIVPTFGYKESSSTFLAVCDFPVGFAYLASSLRYAGHEVFGLNPNNDFSFRSNYEMLYNKINLSFHKYQPQLIGLGGLCTDYKFIKDSIHIIRKMDSNIPIVCGGGIISNDAEFIFNTLKPDFCIIEEGEEIYVQLANMIQSKINNFKLINNLGYWEKGSAKFTKRDFDYIDLNKRCFPDYEPFGIKEMLDNYSMASRYLYRYTRKNPRPMPIVTARSCPFSCTFCVHEAKPKYRARSIENIIREIELLYENYCFNILVIVDELFTVNKTRMHEFCNALLNKRNTNSWDFDWLFQTHASAKLKHDDLELLKRSGCYFFGYGMESASESVLISMNKKTNPTQIKEAVEIADSVKIGFGGNFIFGDAAETPETINETMIFFSKHCLNIHVFLSWIQPYPGSKLFEDCFKKGMFGNKLKFYKHIQERIWNMTSMPDKFWMPWSYLLVLSRSDDAGSLQSSPWLKATHAIMCIEIENDENKIGMFTGKSMYKITALCPFCNKEVSYRELLKTKKKGSVKALQLNNNLSLREIIKSHILKIYSLFPKRNFVYRKLLNINLIFKIFIWYLFNFRNPHFKKMIISLSPTLVPVKTSGNIAFDTGCIHCNKRFKIITPIKDTGNRFNKRIRKLLFKIILKLSKT